MGTMGSHCGHLPSLDQAATRPTRANRSSEKAAVFIVAEGGQHRKAERWCRTERGKGKQVYALQEPIGGSRSDSSRQLNLTKMGGSWRRLSQYGLRDYSTAW